MKTKPFDTLKVNVINDIMEAWDSELTNKGLCRDAKGAYWLLTDYDGVPVEIDGLKLVDLQDGPYGAVDALGMEEGYAYTFDFAKECGLVVGFDY